MFYKYERSPNFTLAADPVLGFHLGGFIKVPMRKKFFFLPEIQFSKRGWSNAVGPTAMINYSMNYLELPLIFSYVPSERFLVNLGPSASFLIAAKTKIGSNSRDFTESHRKFNLGVNVGASYDLTRKIAVIGRYFHALAAREELEFRNENNIQTGTAKNYLTSLQFGLSYALKK